MPAAAVPWDAPARDRCWASTRGDPAVWGHGGGTGTPGERKLFRAISPFPVRYFTTRGCVCAFISGIMTRSPQALQARCAGLGLSWQGCKGRLPENSPAVAGGTRGGFSLQPKELPQPAHPLLGTRSLPPPAMGLPPWWDIPRCCQNAAGIPTSLREQSSLSPAQTAPCRTAGSAAACHSHPGLTPWPRG